MKTKENDALGDTSHLASNFDISNKKFEEDKTKTK